MLDKIKNIFKKNNKIKNSKYFTGASHNREDGMGDFDHRRIDFSDQFFDREIYDLRNRCFRAYFNYPLATSVINTFTKYTTPLKFQSKVKNSNLSADEILVINNFIEDLFYKNFSKNIDYNGEYNFKSFQDAVAFSYLIFGEAIIVRRYLKNPRGGFRTKYQIIPPEMVVSPGGRNIIDQGINNGIKFNSEGQPDSIYVLKYRPSMSQPNPITPPESDLNNIKFYDKNGYKQVFHLYNKLFPWQYRGIPILTPVLKDIHNIKKYNDSEWMKKRMIANLVYFHQSANPEKTYLDSILAQDINTGDEVEIIESLKMEPGEIVYGNTEDELKAIDSDMTDNNFDSYLKHNIEIIGSALSIAPFLISGDYGSINYSSARAGLISTKNVFKKQIEYYIDNLYDYMINDFINEAVDAKYIEGFDKEDLEFNFIYPKIELMDPAKEMSAIVTQLENQLTSKTEVIKNLGYDIDDILYDLKTERDKFKDLENDMGQIDKE